MHSRPFTAKQVLQSNVDTSSDASEDERRPVSRSRSSRTKASRQFWKVKRVPRGPRTFRRVNNASARKIVTTLARQTAILFFSLFFTKPAGHRRDFFSQVYPDDLFCSSKIIISIRENILHWTLDVQNLEAKVETPIVIDVNESDGRRVVPRSVRKPIAVNFRNKLRRTWNFRPLAFSIYRYVERSRRILEEIVTIARVGAL